VGNKKNPYLCIVPYCRKRRGGAHRKCYMHMQQRYREYNPIMSFYHGLKSNAKIRGILFAVSFSVFKKFVLETGYMDTKGLRADDMTIDRKDSRLGYVEGNLQLLPRSVNSSKNNETYHSARYLEYLRRTGQLTEQPKPQIENNGDPF